MSELLQYPGESQNDHLSPDAKKQAHSRRNWLFKLAILMNGAVGALLSIPILGYVLGPAFKKERAITPGSISVRSASSLLEKLGSSIFAIR